MPFPKSKLLSSQDQSLPLIEIKKTLHDNYYSMNNEILSSDGNKM